MHAYYPFCQQITINIGSLILDINTCLLTEKVSIILCIHTHIITQSNPGWTSDEWQTLEHFLNVPETLIQV
jgi:hypothetical protein